MTPPPAPRCHLGITYVCSHLHARVLPTLTWTVFLSPRGHRQRGSYVGAGRGAAGGARLPVSSAPSQGDSVLSLLRAPQPRVSAPTDRGALPRGRRAGTPSSDAPEGSRRVGAGVSPPTARGATCGASRPTSCPGRAPSVHARQLGPRACRGRPVRPAGGRGQAGESAAEASRARTRGPPGAARPASRACAAPPPPRARDVSPAALSGAPRGPRAAPPGGPWNCAARGGGGAHGRGRAWCAPSCVPGRGGWAAAGRWAAGEARAEPGSAGRAGPGRPGRPGRERRAGGAQAGGGEAPASDPRAGPDRRAGPPPPPRHGGDQDHLPHGRGGDAVPGQAARGARARHAGRLQERAQQPAGARLQILLQVHGPGLRVSGARGQCGRVGTCLRAGRAGGSGDRDPGRAGGRSGDRDPGRSSAPHGVSTCLCPARGHVGP